MRKLALSSLLLVTALLTGCTPINTTPPPVANEAGVRFEHIHELVPDPRDGSLLVATHEGLYRLTLPNGNVNRYVYKQGVLHEVHVDRALFDLVFRRS